VVVEGSQIVEVVPTGVRVLLTRVSMTLGEHDGGLPPQSTVQDADAILADSERLIATYHERGPGAMVQIGLAPCSPFSVTREIRRDTAALAEHHDVRLHTHLAETIDEEDFCREMFGLRTVDYLDSVGWLSSRTWWGHGIHFDDTEIARLGAAGTGVAHCPSSNMRLASGIARTVELETAGVPVGIGVDGSAANDASNMILEARRALCLQRLRYGTDQITPERALTWATAGSARVLGRDDVGTIAVGQQADLALLTLDDLRSRQPRSAVRAAALRNRSRRPGDGRRSVAGGRRRRGRPRPPPADHRPPSRGRAAHGPRPLTGLAIALFATVIWFFPPVVTGVVITTIGLTLLPVAAIWAGAR
jgi:8-oxoguanine deaminase